MRTLVVYDSVYGNTERIAEAIAAALACDARRAGDTNPAQLGALDLLVVGSPTQGGRPTPAIRELLAAAPAGVLTHTVAAAFDTRIVPRRVASRLFLNVLGYAAGRIGAALRRKGARLAGEPEGFIVEGKEGPLRAGEEDRAVEWAGGVMAAVDGPARPFAGSVRAR